MTAQIVGAFFAVYMFSALLDVPKKYAHYSAGIGAVGWYVYMGIQADTNSAMMAAFLSTLMIALLSHMMARIKRAPVTVFLISGILPSVPGAAMYRFVHYLIQNDFALSNHYLIETLQIAGAIAMAIFIMDSIFRLVQVYSESRHGARQ